jgi:diguanylate cyclase (GGDEF)-like protein
VATNARRRTREFRLALIDLDGFKSINDTFGHRAGDELLRTIGTRLTHSMRVEDTVARLGGDEFAVLIQSSYDLDSVQAVDARIRKMIEQPVMIDGSPLCPSCSIGVSLCPNDGFEFEPLLEHADRNMYKQKLEHRRYPSLAPKCRYPGAATAGEVQSASCQRVDHVLSAECMGRACWVRELEPMV